MRPSPSHFLFAASLKRGLCDSDLPAVTALLLFFIWNSGTLEYLNGKAHRDAFRPNGRTRPSDDASAPFGIPGLPLPLPDFLSSRQ